MTCGEGNQTRTRTCWEGSLEGSADDCVIGNLDTQTRYCYMDDCPLWGVWGGWSECSKTCNNGTRTRTRDCTNADDFFTDYIKEGFKEIGREDLICDGIETVSSFRAFFYFHFSKMNTATTKSVATTATWTSLIRSRRTLETLTPCAVPTGGMSASSNVQLVKRGTIRPQICSTTASTSVTCTIRENGTPTKLTTLLLPVRSWTRPVVM